MGSDMFLIDIIIFAAIAGFLVLRLRKVLGQRHGEERKRPNPLQSSKDVVTDNVVRMPEKARLDAAPDEPLPIEGQIAQLRKADPSFDENVFLQGARMAFEMIVNAFAAGDKQTLRPLLADDVYAAFAKSIDDRVAAGHVLETQISSVEEPDLKSVSLKGWFAHVTVRFTSHQINVTRDAAGTVIDGNTDETVEVTDIWTFARDVRAPDPNWALVETRAPA